MTLNMAQKILSVDKMKSEHLNSTQRTISGQSTICHPPYTIPTRKVCKVKVLEWSSLDLNPIEKQLDNFQTAEHSQSEKILKKTATEGC